MIEALAEWNEWWKSGEVDAELLGQKRALSREADDFFSFREIKTVTGLRRSGKSTLLYQFIDNLLKEKMVDRKRILLVNFEDPVLAGATLGEIFDAYQTHINPDKLPYIFLDEVHRCREWALFLRKLYDLKKIEQAFITDSSSRFVRAEYASVLTGREISFTMFPLSLSEYLEWNDTKTVPPYSQSDVNRIKHHLNTYLRWGGMPEVALKTSETHKKILLNNYLGDIVHKDIVERYNANYKKIKGLVDYLVANPGTLFSPRKYLKMYGLSLDSLNTYLGHLEDVFLVHLIPKFSYSVKSQQLSQKKVYLLDTGFFGGASYHFSENTGHIYENAVLINLLRKEKEIYYWKGKQECDFVIKDGNRLSTAIQVCCSLNADTKEREVGGLLEAMDSLNIETGVLVTSDKEGTEEVDGRLIQYIPLWKYLLSPQPDSISSF